MDAKMATRLEKVLTKTLPDADIINVHWSDDNIVKKVSKSHAIVLSGSDYRIKRQNAAILPKKLWKLGKPMLGICYGLQSMAAITNTHCIGSFNKMHKYTKYIELKENFPFAVPRLRYKFAHCDFVDCFSTKGWLIAAHSPDGEQIWAAHHPERNFIGLQFHPELSPKSARIFFPAWLQYIKSIV